MFTTVYALRWALLIRFCSIFTVISETYKLIWDVKKLWLGNVLWRFDQLTPDIYHKHSYEHGHVTIRVWCVFVHFPFVDIKYQWFLVFGGIKKYPMLKCMYECSVQKACVLSTKYGYTYMARWSLKVPKNSNCELFCMFVCISLFLLYLPWFSRIHPNWYIQTYKHTVYKHTKYKHTKHNRTN